MIELTPEQWQAIAAGGGKKMLDKDEEAPKTNGTAASLPNGEQPTIAKSPNDDRPWRGVFLPAPNREILFTTDLDLTNLPQWEPHVYIDAAQDRR